MAKARANDRRRDGTGNTRHAPFALFTLPLNLVGLVVLALVSLGLRDTVVRSMAAPRAGSIGRAPVWAELLGGPFRTIRGLAETPAHVPLEGVRVDAVLVLEGRTYPMGTASSAANGTFSIERLPEGSYWLLGRAPQRARAGVVVRVHGGDPALTTLRLGPGASIAGRVTRDVRGGREPEAVRDVVVRASPDSGGEGPPFATRTNAQGEFVIDDLPPGSYRVEVAEPGFEPIVRRAVPAPSRGMALALRALASIRGLVRDRGGRGVPGAEITLAGSGVWPARSTRSGRGGAFEIVSIPSGVYELRARDGTDVAEPVAPLVLDPGDVRDATLLLGPGATLAGTVVDAATQRPLARARVVITEDAISTAPQAMVADANGAFRVQGLLARTHQISASADGYVPRVGTLATPGGPVVVVGLDREVIVSGRVVDARGDAVPGAQIEVVATDLDGRSSMLTAAAVAFRDSLFRAQAGGPRPLIQAGELGVMPGPVPMLPLAPGGAPGANLMQNPTAGVGYVTDSSGRFRIGGVPPGVVSVGATHPAYVRGETAQRAARPGETLEVEIVMHPGGTIDGRLVDEGGFPIASQIIEVRTTRDAFPRRVFTARDGTFRVPSVLGRVAVVALMGGRPMARVEVEIADDAIVPVTLTLDRNVRRVRGRVLDDHGYPVAGAEITLVASRESAGASRTITLEDGTFETMVAGAGPVELEVRHPRHAPRTLRADAVGSDVAVTLEPGGDVVFSVRSDGCTAGDIAVELRTACGPVRRSVRPGAELRLEHLCPGRVVIVAQAPGCVRSERSAAIVGGRNTEIAALELGAGGGAMGDVVDGHGEPVPGATVSLPDTAADALAGTARTDRRGQFAIQDLPDGDLALVATHPLLGRSRQAPVRVFHGSVARGVRLVFERDLATATRERDATTVVLVDRAGSVVVGSVPRDSAASRAGLQAGDVVVRIGTHTVSTSTDGARALQGPRGDDVVVVVRRDRAERTIRWIREE